MGECTGMEKGSEGINEGEDVRGITIDSGVVRTIDDDVSEWGV